MYHMSVIYHSEREPATRSRQIAKVPCLVSGVALRAEKDEVSKPLIFWIFGISNVWIFEFLDLGIFGLLHVWNISIEIQKGISQNPKI